MQVASFHAEPPRSSQTPLVFVPERYATIRPKAGSLSAGLVALRAMADAPDAVRTTPLKSTLLGEDAPKCWVHLTVFGEWNGHGAGYFAFDREVLERICDNFERQKNTVTWTYEHPEKWTGAPVPSAGRTRQLQIRGDGSKDTDGLWALVEWTATAAEMIRAGEYKYCSVVVDLEARDRVTNEPIGCELREVGLTDTPFIDGQQPIPAPTSFTLSRLQPRTEPHMTTTRDLKKTGGQAADAQSVLDDVASALELETSDPDKIKARVDALVQFIKAMSPDAPPDAEMPASMDDAAAMSADKRASWIKRLAVAQKALRKLADDAPDWTGGGTIADAPAETDADKALDAALAADGVDLAALAAWITAHPGELMSIVNGGVPEMKASQPLPAEYAQAKLRLETAEATVRSLKGEVDKLTAAARARDEAEKAAAEKARVEAETAEREATIKAGMADGRIVSDDHAGKVRKFFADYGHKAGMGMVAGLETLVPAGAISAEAARTVAASADKPTPKPADGEFDYTPRDHVEVDFCARYSGETLKRKLSTRRRSVALSDAA